MPTWLLLITSALAQPQADLSCSLQEGATWNADPGAVSAVECDGVPGFFVPSAVFRSMRKPQESRIYKLLDRELELANQEIESLRKSIDSGDEVLAKWKGLSSEYEGNWRKAEADVQAMEGDVVEAAERGWYESPLLWMAIGAAAVGTAWAVSASKDAGPTVVVAGSAGALRP